MQTTHWVLVLLVCAAVVAVVVGVVTGQEGGQTRPDPSAYLLAACAASQPVVGGKVYLYVVDQPKHVVTVIEDGLMVASYRLRNPSKGSWYTVVAGRSEPVDGGQAYAFVIDQAEGILYSFRGQECLGVQTLPAEGERL